MKMKSLGTWLTVAQAVIDAIKKIKGGGDVGKQLASRDARPPKA